MAVALAALLAGVTVSGLSSLLRTDHDAALRDDARRGEAPAWPAESLPSAPPSVPSSPSPRLVERGSGSFDTVPGSARAPGQGKVLTVRVEVERGADAPARGFAGAVMQTLNDPRSWGQGRARTFARTDGRADIRVLLASPVTSAELCRPLVTRGRVSCSVGNQAIITNYRWARGTVEFPDLTLYRQYVVNHEVGHVLGAGHQRCPGAGRVAPVMQQQTIKVAPCTPNAWPYP